MEEENQNFIKIHPAVEIFYILGLSLSVLCLILQIVLYILIPHSRKLDQKVLTQLTVARILNVLFEYLVTCVQVGEDFRFSVFALYLHTDAALICWMFVFTKILYDKVTKVFTQETRFTLISVTIWMVTFPIGLLCPLLLSLEEKGIIQEIGFKYFYKTYGIAKFCVLTVNLLFFIKICIVAVRRTDRAKCLLRTCIISCLLVSITSAQVLVTDLLSFFLVTEFELSIAFGVFNSFQTIAITIIFVILVHGACEESLQQTLKLNFMKKARSSQIPDYASSHGTLTND